MRRTRLRFDIWLCLLIGYVISMGTGELYDILNPYSPKDYDAYVEEHTVEEGDIGGIAGDEIPRAQSVEDLLNYDVFTVVSPGIEYRNRGAGYYGSDYLYALTLPSGERVAAHINGKSVVYTGEDIYSGDNILPVGRVVYADLTEDESFLNQIEYSEPLSRRDFYVDMAGDGMTMSEDSFIEIHNMHQTVVQVITVLICFPILHMLGSKLGIFPAFFVRKKKDKSEWD